MSYRGYEQMLCENGHLWCCPAFSYEGEEKCACGASVAFVNSVDDTNCDSYGIILDEGWKTLLIEEELNETCSHCNHTKQVRQARYRVPTKEELQKLCMRRETNDSGSTFWVQIYKS